MTHGETEGKARRHVEMKRSRRQPPEIVIVATPAYDFFWSLFIAFCPPYFHEIEASPDWIAEGREACPPDVRATLSLFFNQSASPGWNTPRLCALLWRAPAPGDVPATIDWLGQVPVHEVLTLIIERDGLGEGWREIAESLVADPEPRADAEFRARVQSFAKRFPAAEREDLLRFLLAPEDERRRLIAALHVWHDCVFAAQAPRLRAALDREGARLRQLKQSSTPEELFARVLRGVAFDPPAAVERVVLAPSTLIMPTIYSLHHDDTLTFCYPFDQLDQQRDAAVVQRGEMVRLFDALADDTRLRILALLAERRMYLTELADHLKLTKATTRHHMIRLRAAGLVTVHAQDHLSYYTLRRETLDEPTRILQGFLNLPRHS